MDQAIVGECEIQRISRESERSVFWEMEASSFPYA